MSIKKTARLILLVFLLIPVLPLSCMADEVIEDFVSSIAVMPDGVMKVREDITVRVEHRKIRHGIYRDFPTVYQNTRGERVKVGFQVREVLLDGIPVKKSISRQDNGVRIRIGDPDSYVPPGSHTYSIEYVTTGQLGLFEDHDELYWNVTGNGWDFPIMKASARISLPPGTPLEDLVWFTGPQGSRERKASGYVRGNEAFVEITAPLGSKEGLTFALYWPKGYIIPSSEYYREAKRQENLSRLKTLLPLGIILLILGYYLLVWFLHGRDLRPGRVIPLFHPPERVGPAIASFLVNQGYADEAFTSTIIDLAVRGYLVIEELGSAFPYHSGGTFANGHLGSLRRFRSRVTDKTYVLKRTEKGDGLDRTEGGFLSLLFPYGDILVINQSSREALRETKKYLERELKEFCLPLVRKNLPYVVAGIVLTLLSIGSTGFFLAHWGGKTGIFGFMTAWLSVWTLGVSALVLGVFRAFREGFQKKKGSALFRGVIMGAFSIPFLVGQFAGMGMMAMSTSLYFTIALIAALVLNVLFAKWMKNYTRLGRAIMDKLEGFRMYLSTAEKERIRRFASVDMPEDTPEQFEKMLPYAVALNVEKTWAERFAHVLEVSEYQPGWYVGPGPYFFYGGDSFASNLSNGLSGAISSAATPPGSSSGFGGGGSSGGGGGGGGGGGW